MSLRTIHRFAVPRCRPNKSNTFSLIESRRWSSTVYLGEETVPLKYDIVQADSTKHSQRKLVLCHGLLYARFIFPVVILTQYSIFFIHVAHKTRQPAAQSKTFVHFRVNFQRDWVLMSIQLIYETTAPPLIPKR